MHDIEPYAVYDKEPRGLDSLGMIPESTLGTLWAGHTSLDIADGFPLCVDKVAKFFRNRRKCLVPSQQDTF